MIIIVFIVEKKYIKAAFDDYWHYQKYCKKCLSSYLSKITDNNKYLDVYLYTKNLECNEHEISKTKEPQNIQECCKNCLEILCFKQLPTRYNNCNTSSPYYNYSRILLKVKNIVNYVENHYIKEQKKWKK